MALSRPAELDPPIVEPVAPRRHNGKLWLAVGALMAFLVAYSWVVDFVAFTGERTVYTVQCKGGSWSGNSCSGTLAAGPRYRYRVLKAHSEVLFWIVGSSEPAGKLSHCTIESGRSWSCPASEDAARTVTLAISHGQAVADGGRTTRELHSVSKLHWLLLQLGMNMRTTANE